MWKHQISTQSDKVSVCPLAYSSGVKSQCNTEHLFWAADSASPAQFLSLSSASIAVKFLVCGYLYIYNLWEHPNQDSWTQRVTQNLKQTIYIFTTYGNILIQRHRVWENLPAHFISHSARREKERHLSASHLFLEIKSPRGSKFANKSHKKVGKLATPGVY